MGEILGFVLVAVGAATIMGGLAWLGSRARRRGVGRVVMGPFDEIWHPAAHRYRVEIQAHEERVMPVPSADDRWRRRAGRQPRP